MMINVGMGGIETNLGDLDHILHQAGFTRHAWDYDHATYDYKYEDKTSNSTYYLRLLGNIVQGSGSEDQDAVLRLEEPHIGKHLFPHGIDYEAQVPNIVLENARKKLNALKQKLM